MYIILVTTTLVESLHFHNIIVISHVTILLEAAGWTTSISCNLGSKQTSIHKFRVLLDFLICGGYFFGVRVFAGSKAKKSSDILRKLHVGFTLYKYSTVCK